jgi:hypothetical protein
VNVIKEVDVIVGFNNGWKSEKRNELNGWKYLSTVVSTVDTAKTMVLLGKNNQ